MRPVGEPRVQEKEEKKKQAKQKAVSGGAAVKKPLHHAKEAVVTKEETEKQKKPRTRPRIGTKAYEKKQLSTLRKAALRYKRTRNYAEKKMLLPFRHVMAFMRNSTNHRMRITRHAVDLVRSAVQAFMIKVLARANNALAIHTNKRTLDSPALALEMINTLSALNASQSFVIPGPTSADDINVVDQCMEILQRTKSYRAERFIGLPAKSRSS